MRNPRPLAALAVTSLALFAGGCSVETFPEQEDPSAASKVLPAGRAEDVELAPGPDLEHEPVEAASVEEYMAENGLTESELEEALAGEPPPAAGTLQTQSLLGGIGKVITSFSTIPNALKLGSWVSGLGVLASKNLFLVGGTSSSSLTQKLLTSFGSLSCVKQGVPLLAVPSSQAAKLVAKFGGRSADYGLCISSTFVAAGGSFKVSTRTYADKRKTPDKVVAIRTIIDKGSKSTVIDVPSIF